MITPGSQRAGAAAAGRAELEVLRTRWGDRGSWNLEWVAAHPERDANRSASTWRDAEQANVRADAAAEAAHAESDPFAWKEGCVQATGGGRWALKSGARLEAPDARVAWRLRSKNLGIEYARKRLDQGSLNEMGWATVVWEGVKDRDWSELTFRCRLWWGHLLPHNARHTGVCELCGEGELDQMQWHLLARCQHKGLLEARLEAAEEIRERFTKTARALRLPITLHQEVSDQLGGVSPRWTLGEGEREVGGALGRYGKISKEWVKR